MTSPLDATPPAPRQAGALHVLRVIAVIHRAVVGDRHELIYRYGARG